LGKSLRYYQQAAQLAESQLPGRSPLDLDTIQDSTISVVYTYLSATEGLAHTLATMGKKADAVRHYQEVLQLVPEDPYYIRGRLLPLLLELGRVQEADRLLEDYPDPYNPDWLYTRALRLFQRKGNTRHSRQALQQALESNPLIVDQLINPGYDEEEVPDIMPFAEMLEESHSYRKRFLFLWQRTPGAIQWLEKQTLSEGKNQRKS
jgi:tetratricopeptide (TPR) repeat protein